MEERNRNIRREARREGDQDELGEGMSLWTRGVRRETRWVGSKPIAAGRITVSGVVLPQ